MQHNDLLEVEAFIYGMKIGTLTIYQNRVYFYYEDEFRSKNINISPLKLNVKNYNTLYTNQDNFEVYLGLAGVFLIVCQISMECHLFTDILKIKVLEKMK